MVQTKKISNNVSIKFILIDCWGVEMAWQIGLITTYRGSDYAMILLTITLQQMAVVGNKYRRHFYLNEYSVTVACSYADYTCDNAY